MIIWCDFTVFLLHMLSHPEPKRIHTRKGNRW